MPKVEQARLPDFLTLRMQRLAAVGAAVAMLVAAYNVRANWQTFKNTSEALARQPLAELTAEPAEPQTVPSSPQATEAAPAITAPGEPTPETASRPVIVLGSGFMADGGLRFDQATAGGVDCLPSYQPDPGVDSRQFTAAWPLDLERGIRLIPNDRNVVVVGEEVGRPSFGNVTLSHGWAVEYVTADNLYNVYEFDVQEQPDQPMQELLPIAPARADAVGRLVASLSLVDMRAGQEFSNELADFAIELRGAASTAEPVVLTIRCREP